MKTKTKLIIAIILALIGIFIFINQSYDKKDNIYIVNQSTIPNQQQNTTTSINIPKNTKKSKKVVKTTKKTANKKVVKTASLSEYQQYAKSYGNYNEEQMNCLINLWNKESGWNANSVNKTSGACGIPQAYPCKKIKQSEGSNDWKAQIRWGIKYINYRYKTPCGAWSYWTKHHWY